KLACASKHVHLVTAHQSDDMLLCCNTERVTSRQWQCQDICSGAVNCLALQRLHHWNSSLHVTNNQIVTDLPVLVSVCVTAGCATPPGLLPDKQTITHATPGVHTQF